MCKNKKSVPINKAPDILIDQPKINKDDLMKRKRIKLSLKDINHFKEIWNFFKGCLPQTSLGSFLNVLLYVYINNTYTWVRISKYIYITGLWKLQSGIRIEKLIIWVTSFEIKKILQVYRGLKIILSSPGL